MVNSNKLKSMLVEKSLKQAEVASLLGISTNSFNRKLNNKKQFTLKEAYSLVGILDISDLKDTFFKEEISNMQQEYVS